MQNETRGAVFKKQQFITVWYSTCVRIEMKQDEQFSKKNSNLLQYAIQLVCILKWNKMDSFQKKNTIYYSMLFNLCAYWNETRGVVFKKIQLMTICYWTHVRNETRGAVFKKQQFITVCYSTSVRIEMKQEGQFSKKNTNLLQYAIQLVCILKWNKRGSFQKTTIYYSMLFNLCAYWNETRGTVFKKIQFMTICYSTCVRNETRGAVFKKQQFITVCYSTCVHIEMKQEGQFSKKTNLLQYAIHIEMKQEGQFSKKQQFITIQLVCVLKWNKRDSFQKKHNLLQYAIQLVCVLKWNKRDSFQKKKNTNLLQYAIQLVCILKWNKMDSFQKNPINDNMLLNLCAKWNKRGSFQKTTIYYSMLFNLCPYWNETRGTVFKKNKKKLQFITVCYSTCVHIEMKQEGQFSKKNNLLQYAIQLVCVLEWNKRGSFQKNPIWWQYAA